MVLSPSLCTERLGTEDLLGAFGHDRESSGQRGLWDSQLTSGHGVYLVPCKIISRHFFGGGLPQDIEDDHHPLRESRSEATSTMD